MKYKCLILDHDDTVVNSTVQVHYPSMAECMAELRPDYKLSFEEFNLMNFEPGFYGYVNDILKFTPYEIQRETEIWRKWTLNIRPDFFPGIKDVITEFKNRGGIIAVSSHSEKEIILLDYAAAGCVPPDEIFGWELPPEKRKPDTYAVDVLKEKYNLAPSDIIMLDDMKHGLVMCRNSGVKCIFANWSEKPGKIIKYMQENCDFAVNSPSELNKILF